MNILILALSIIASTILHNIILPYFSVLSITPNISLAVLISVSFLARRPYGCYLGLALGFFEDILFNSVVGVHALIYFFLAIALERVDKRVVRDSYYAPLLAMVLTTIGYNLFYYVIMYFLSSSISFIHFMKNKLWIEIIYNCIIIIPVYKLYSNIFVAPAISFTRD